MLVTIGAGQIDDLFVDVPASGAPRRRGRTAAPSGRNASGTTAFANAAAKKHDGFCRAFFCGAGAYKHHVPATVDHIIQRSEFLTSYTPYQPEITQGTLQYLFEFQTQVSELTGMPVANASMYDGSTATAEAVLMAHRVKRKAVRFVGAVASALHGGD